MISTLATVTRATVTPTEQLRSTQSDLGFAVADADLCSRARRLSLVVIPATRVSAAVSTIGGSVAIETTGGANTAFDPAAGFAPNHASFFTAAWVGGYPAMAKKDHSQRKRPT